MVTFTKLFFEFSTKQGGRIIMRNFLEPFLSLRFIPCQEQTDNREATKPGIAGRTCASRTRAMFSRRLYVVLFRSSFSCIYTGGLCMAKNASDLGDGVAVLSMHVCLAVENW